MSDTEPTAASRTVGGFDVLALVDASGEFPMSREEAFLGASQRAWSRARAVDPGAFGRDGAWHLDFRCFVIRLPGDRFALVDAGVGPSGSPASAWAPVPGVLPDELAGAGIGADQVTLVVLTHLHADHFGWSVTPDGVPVFGNARYVVRRTEVEVLEHNGDQVVLPYVVEPLRRTGQLDLVEGDACLVADRAAGRITAVPTPGHTLGHQSVLVDGGRDRLLITGDLLVHAVQLVDPDVVYWFEQENELLARRTRHRVFTRAAASRTTLATAHLTRPFITIPG